ncbi:MAG: EscU/YscU/HrcU family type III secretion system export apparatus switch protein, partial [Lachnospiraceae bacterium]|nr:EscU/YscU/HrcU family type III secretion system export apparatus switch protein [Lachnospiraceae bacterium]
MINKDRGEEFNIRLFELDLQFFAKDGPGGEKTEEPTAKKKNDTRKEGNVAKSRELETAVTLLFMFITMKVYCGTLGLRFIETFNSVYSQMGDISTFVGGDTPQLYIRKLYMSVILRVLLYLAPFLLVAFIVGFIVNLVQVKWKPTTKPLKPKLSKLNPVKGFKKIFSLSKMVDLLKSLIKLGIIGGVAYSTIIGEVSTVFMLYDMSIKQAIQFFGNIVINMGIKVSACYIVLGFADYAYQKHKFHEDIKMTKQEVKDEMKNAEGDPKIKAKQRQRMMEASRRRMMSAVPKADVVITNPTHFAVALKYDPDEMPAPYVVAKGEDLLAAR